MVSAVRAPDRAADDRAGRVMEQHGARERASYTEAL
jgi:hypothetical protein